MLDLRGTSVGDIEDVRAAWPPHLLLGGFRYSVLAGVQGEKAVFADQPVKWYEGWLHLDPTFSRATYLQLENTMPGLGRDGDADRIAMASKDEDSSESSVDRRALALLYRTSARPRQQSVPPRRYPLGIKQCDGDRGMVSESDAMVGQ